MAETVVDVLEGIIVEVQHGRMPSLCLHRAQRALQRLLECRPVEQSGQRVVAGPVGERAVLMLQLLLPVLQFVEQAVEVFSQRMQFGDVRGRGALLEGTIRAYRMCHPHQVAHRLGDVRQHAARHIVGADRGEQQAGQQAEGAAGEEAEQVGRIPDRRR